MREMVFEECHNRSLAPRYVVSPSTRISSVLIEINGSNHIRVGSSPPSERSLCTPDAAPCNNYTLYKIVSPVRSRLRFIVPNNLRLECRENYAAELPGSFAHSSAKDRREAHLPVQKGGNVLSRPEVLTRMPQNYSVHTSLSNTINVYAIACFTNSKKYVMCASHTTYPI